MAKIRDVEPAMQKIYERLYIAYRNNNLDVATAYMNALGDIKSAPIMKECKGLFISPCEYEPIIRCSNCVHFDKAYRNERVDGICNYWNCHEVMDDWYCSQAQKGEG